MSKNKKIPASEHISGKAGIFCFLKDGSGSLVFLLATNIALQNVMLQCLFEKNQDI